MNLYSECTRLTLLVRKYIYLKILSSHFREIRLQKVEKKGYGNGNGSGKKSKELQSSLKYYALYLSLNWFVDFLALLIIVTHSLKSQLNYS